MYEELENKPHYRFYLFVVIAVFAFAFGWQARSFGLFGSETAPAKLAPVETVKTADKNKNPDVDMNLFWKVWKLLSDQYVDASVVKNENMVYGAIKGMVNSLGDPYTVFMTPDESKQFLDGLEGTLEGIGAELTVKNKKLTVVSPVRKSPAEKAGLMPGDIIEKIDGKSAAEMTLIDAIMGIRGKKGTAVVLTISRDKSDKPFDVSIVRDSINIDSVTMEKLDNEIVYLAVNQFNEKTKEEFGKYISAMVLNEPKGLIVDFRFNGGGYLESAVELLSYLLPKDTAVVKLVDRVKGEDVKYTNGNPKILNVPLVVLVNEGSASASEIVAGAIQDKKRGVMMGTKTFGKGTVQQVEYFPDGSSMRMTIAKWLTPNGRDINKTGLTPDVIVEIKDEDIKKQKDTQKDAAVEYLKGLK